MFLDDHGIPATAPQLAKDETALTPKAEKPKRVRKPRLLDTVLAEARRDAGGDVAKPKRVRTPKAAKPTTAPSDSTPADEPMPTDVAKPKRVRPSKAAKAKEKAKTKRVAKPKAKRAVKAKTKRVAKAAAKAKSPKRTGKAKRKVRILPPFKALPKGSLIKWASAAGCKGEKHNHRGTILVFVPRLVDLAERTTAKMRDALTTSNYGVSNRDRYIVETKDGSIIAANAKAASLVDAK